MPRRTVFFMFAVSISLSLQGCAAAIPLAATAATTGGIAYGANKSAESAANSGLDALEMNCSQLNVEYDRLNSNTLQKFNPFANQAAKAAQIKAIGQSKGCRNL